MKHQKQIFQPLPGSGPSQDSPAHSSLIKPAGMLNARNKDETGGKEVTQGSSSPGIKCQAVCDSILLTLLQITARPHNGQAPQTPKILQE